MNTRLLKKEVAQLAGVTPRTMRRNREQYRWLDRCRCAGTRRPTYHRDRVQEELRRRNMI